MHTHKRETIQLSAIRLDGNTQPREAINEATVAEYAEALSCGAIFPPLVVFTDGVSYTLVDGFHRFHANVRLGIESTACEVHTGTQRDAVLWSLGANDAHGLRRTNADKRKAVLTMLKDPEWSSWSRQKIAEACKVSAPFVTIVREESKNVSGVQPAPTVVTTQNKRGTTMTVDTGAISEAQKNRHAEEKARKQAAIESQHGPATTVAGSSLEVEHAPPVEAVTPSNSSNESCDSLREELEQARDVAHDLAVEVKALRAAGTVDGAEAEIRRLTAVVRAIEAERDTYKHRCSEQVRQIKSLERQIATLERKHAGN